MSDIDVQMEGVVTPTYDKRRKGYKFKQDGMEIFIKGEDKDAAMKQMSELLESNKEEDTEVHSFAEGGMEDGGLKDEGGTVDPVSGNEVPSGSTQSEVRDDIPAQLSEGEFVFPADVVRYIGLENLMELRAKAKQGLAKMEAMGQMGNSDEATMEDNGEYESEIDDLIDNFDPNDPESMEFSQGGVVYAQQGAYMQGQPQQQFSYGFMPPQQQGFQAPGYSVMPTQTPFITSPARVAVGQAPVAPENRTYVGPDGTEIIIPFYDGKPMKGYVIPKGFKYKSPEEAVAETPEIAQPVVTQPDGGGGDGPEDSPPDMSGFDISIANDTLGMIGPDDPGFAGLNAATQAAQSAKTKAGIMGLVSFIAPFGIGAKAAEKAQQDYINAEKKMRQELGKVQQTNPKYRAQMIEKAVEQMQDDYGLSEKAARGIANEMDAVSRGEDFNIEDDAIPEQDVVNVGPNGITIGGKSLSEYARTGGAGDGPSTTTSGNGDSGIGESLGGSEGLGGPDPDTADTTSEDSGDYE